LATLGLFQYGDLHGHKFAVMGLAVLFAGEMKSKD